MNEEKAEDVIFLDFSKPFDTGLPLAAGRSLVVLPMAQFLLNRPVLFNVFNQ